jgi:hypothetical protein
MKNSDLPPAYQKAIKSKKIENTTVDLGTEKRSRTIQTVNVLRTLDQLGILPNEIDQEAILKSVESKGIQIPALPLERLTEKEKRSFTDSLKAIDLTPGNLTPRQKQIWQEFQLLKAQDEIRKYGYGKKIE